MKKKQPWEQTFAEWKPNGDVADRLLHRRMVIEAVIAGKKVPLRVIRQYPEIKKGKMASRVIKTVRC